MDVNYVPFECGVWWWWWAEGLDIVISNNNKDSQSKMMVKTVRVKSTTRGKENNHTVDTSSMCVPPEPHPTNHAQQSVVC